MTPSRRGASLVLAAALLLLGGCAWSLIEDGEVRPDRLDELWARTSHARALPRPDAVAARVIERSELADHARRLMAEDWTSQQLADYQDSIVAIGVWPGDRDLERETIAAASGEVVGFYVPTERALYVVSDLRPPLSVRFASALTHRDMYSESLLAHEMVHAIQHAAYPWLLEDGMTWKDQDDAAMALRTAIEGDATQFAYRALEGPEALPPPARFQQRFDDEFATAERDAASRSPLWLHLSLRLPYVQGYRLSYAEEDALLEDPPVSTEQIMHPMLRRAPFTAVDLGALHGRLPRGCRVLWENTLGEFGISVLLRDLGDDWPAAWEGWDGDRYLAARCGERLAFLWLTLWDTTDDAREFAETYDVVADAVRARAGLEAAPLARLDGRQVLVASDPLTPLLADLAHSARRARVANLADLRAHAGDPEPPDTGSARRDD